MLEYDWFLFLIYGLIGRFRSKQSDYEHLRPNRTVKHEIHCFNDFYLICFVQF